MKKQTFFKSFFLPLTLSFFSIACLPSCEKESLPNKQVETPKHVRNKSLDYYNSAITSREGQSCECEFKILDAAGSNLSFPNYHYEYQILGGDGQCEGTNCFPILGQYGPCLGGIAGISCGSPWYSHPTNWRIFPCTVPGNSTFTVGYSPILYSTDCMSFAQPSTSYVQLLIRCKNKPAYQCPLVWEYSNTAILSEESQYNSYVNLAGNCGCTPSITL